MRDLRIQQCRSYRSPVRDVLPFTLTKKANFQRILIGDSEVIDPIERRVRGEQTFENHSEENN